MALITSTDDLTYVNFNKEGGKTWLRVQDGNQEVCVREISEGQAWRLIEQLIPIVRYWNDSKTK